MTILGPVSASGYQSPCRSSRWSVRVPFSSFPAGVRLKLAWIRDGVLADSDCADDSNIGKNAITASVNELRTAREMAAVNKPVRLYRGEPRTNHQIMHFYVAAVLGPNQESNP
jgi:hypothetical protein